MKKFSFLGFIAAAVISFTSCDLINDAQEAIDDYQANQEAKYEESADGLKITVSYKQSGIGIYHIAEFKVEGKDTICTSLVSKTTFLTELAAKAAYDEMIKDMDEQEKAYVKLNGKEITIEHPENIGQKKAGIKFAFLSICQGYKKGGEIISNIEIPNDGDGDGDGDGGQGSLTGQASYVESSDGLTIITSYMQGENGEEIVAKFYVSESNATDTLCASIKYTFFYDSEEKAKIAYDNNTEGMTEEEISEKEYQLSGKTMSCKDPGAEGMPKTYIVIMLKGIYERLKAGIIM